MNKENTHYNRRVYLYLGLIALLMLMLLAYSYHSNSRITTISVPLVEATEEIKLEITLAHLRFEEILSGVRHENFDIVWRHLAEADWYAQAILEGGENIEGVFVPIRDPHIHQHIQKLQEYLATFKRITRERFEWRDNVDASVDIEQRYDISFSAFLVLADEVEEHVKEFIVKETNIHRNIEVTLGFITLFLFILAGIFFYRHQLRQREHTLLLENEIIERKKVEDEARQLRTDLTHAERIYTMGEMTTTVAHELNQPLSAISSYLGMCKNRLYSGSGKPDELLEVIEKVSQQTERASDLIKHLKRFVRKQEPHWEMIDINSAIREIFNLIIADAYKDKADIRLHLNEHIPLVKGDRIQLQQVILNLIHNGIESMSENNKSLCQLTITTSINEHGKVKVCINDVGKGLPDNGLDKLIKPYYTTKPHGLGMGLSICHTIIEAHNGKLLCSSNDVKGTDFYFILPVNDDDTRDNN